jgi:hypothetical protein
MTSATIKLFLPRGDATSLRTAEISNWSGKAIAAPRTELAELLAREELDKAGVYVLIGSDPLTNAARAYIGEAEVIRDRLKQHKAKEFWVSAIVFVSKRREPDQGSCSVSGESPACRIDCDRSVRAGTESSRWLAASRV